jgi:hypothetical protein
MIGLRTKVHSGTILVDSLGSGVTLLLRFGVVVSMVGWNVLGLQLVGVSFL